MHDLSNLKPKPKRNPHLKTYLFIAAFTALNGLYLGLRDHFNRPKYELQNGGKVISLHRGDSSSQTCFLVYTYQLGGDELIDSMPASTDYLEYSSSLIGRYFPVLFNSKNKGAHGLVFLPKQFRYLNVPYPDSLKWVTRVLPSGSL